ncbi:MAG TPA: TolC family protein [Thermoanaerobaculia bacterium]|nr:TolC family protein [Thermoanaerobaculia bacterium]
MKRLQNQGKALAIGAAIGFLALSAGRALAEDRPVVSARAGQRPPRPMPAASPEGIRLSLEQAIGLALANNQDLNVTVNAAEASRYNLFSDQGIFDPVFSAAATRSHAEQPVSSRLQTAAAQTAVISNVTDFSASVQQLAPTGGVFSLGLKGENFRTNSTFYSVYPSKTANLTITLTQPLLRNLGATPTKWLIYIARNTRDATYQAFVRSVQSTVNGVEQAYWDLVYATQNLEVKKESLRIAQDLNRITKIKIDVGSLAPIDITQTEFGIATAEQDIITADGLIGDAQDRLKRLLNVDSAKWAVPIAPTDPVRVAETTIRLEEGTKTALARRPEILSQAYVVDSDRIRYDYWKNQTLPGLNLVGSYGTAGLGGSFAGTTPLIETGFSDAFSDAIHNRNKNWSIGLNVSYPILNRSARGSRGAAQYSWESDKALLTTTEQNVLVEVRAAARAIDTARRQIAAASKGRELAEKNLDAEKKKFDNGMSTTFQVNQIQRDLSAARTTELQALAAYRKALAGYHLAVADILEWKGIQVEGVPEGAPLPGELKAGGR